MKKEKKLEKRVLQVFIYTVLLLTLNIGVLGFAAPYLVSYKDTFAVLVGIASTVLVLGIDAYVCAKLFRKLSEKVN